MSPLHLIVRYRSILLRTTAVEIRSLYAESVLGLAWVLIGPLLLLALYSVVYMFIFRVQPPGLSGAEYALYVFSGLVPTISFSSALNSGAGALAANRQVLLNTVFPAELLPLRAVLVQSVPMPVALTIVAGAVAALKGDLGAAALLVPLVMVLQVMFVAGIVWVLSLLTLAVRDIQQLLQYVMLILLIITPIAYTPEMIPPKLQLLMYANPLYYYVAAFQGMLVFGALPAPGILAACAVLAFGSFWLGFVLFQRVKQTFYDYA